MKKYILILCLFGFCWAHAQQAKYFEKLYAWTTHYKAKRIIETSDTSFAILGLNKTGDLSKAYMMIVDNFGVEKDIFDIPVSNEHNILISSKCGKNKNGNIILLGNAWKYENNEIDGFGYMQILNTKGELEKEFILSVPDSPDAGLADYYFKDNGNIVLTAGVDIKKNNTIIRYPYLIELNQNLEKIYDTLYYLAPPPQSAISDIESDDEDGYYLLLNEGQDTFTGDIRLIHTDSLGVKDWGEFYSFGNDIAYAFIKRKEGGFLIAMESLAFKITRLVFTDEKGFPEKIIDDYFYGSFFGDMLQLEDSTYVVVGARSDHKENFNYHEEDIQIIKLDKEGNELWNRTHISEHEDEVGQMIQTSEGGLMIVASKKISPQGSSYIYPHIFLTKTNCMGLLTEPEASFTYNNLGSQEVSFTNTSLYVYPDSIDGGYYVWDFGDGSALSNEVNPVHTYSEEGEYQVRLTGIVCSDTSVYEQTVLATPTSVSSPASPSLEEALQVYPNPVESILYFEVGGNYSGRQGRVLFYNILGQLALQSAFKNKVDIRDLPGGVYFVVVEVGGERAVEKVVVN